MADEEPPPHEIYWDSVLAQSYTGVRDGEEAAASEPEPKRARHGLQVPDCCVCMEVAAPLVVYNCDHVACGPCTRKLETPRPWRSAGFQCPQCRAMVSSYAVPVFIRERALDMASDEQRRLGEAFLRDYQAAVADPLQNNRVRLAQYSAAQPPPPPPRVRSQSGVDRQLVNQTLDTFMGRVPRRLIQWQANGGFFRVRVLFGLIETLGGPDKHSFKRRLATRLRAGGVSIDQVHHDAVYLSLPIENIAIFDRMRW